MEQKNEKTPTPNQEPPEPPTLGHSKEYSDSPISPPMPPKETPYKFGLLAAIVVIAIVGIGIALAGAMSGGNKSPSTSSATEEQEKAVLTSQQNKEYGLTKQVSLNGVSLMVNPSWEDTSEGKTLRFKTSPDRAIVVSTYSNGNSRAIETFTDVDSYDITVKKTWSENSVNYSIFSEELDDIIYIFFIGGAENGAGFSVLVQIGDTPNDLNEEAAYALFDTVVFSPSEVTIESEKSAPTNTPTVSVSQKSEDYAIAIFVNVDVYYLGASAWSLGDLTIISTTVSDLEDSRREFSTALDKSMTPTDDAVEALGDSVIAAFYRYMDAYNNSSDEYPDETFVSDLEGYMGELNAVTGLSYEFHNQYKPK
jgi:hypothetical protein